MKKVIFCIFIVLEIFFVNCNTVSDRISKLKDNNGFLKLNLIKEESVVDTNLTDYDNLKVSSFTKDILPENVKAFVKLDGSKTIIAHRGIFGIFPEHTMMSHLNAYEAGTDFLEIDINMTKDNELIIFHDLTLNEITDISKYKEFDDLTKTLTIKNEIKKEGIYTLDLNLSDIKKLKVKQRDDKRPHYYDYEFGILTLDEFLDTFIQLNQKTGRTTGVYLEPKNWNFYKQNNKDLQKAIADKLIKYKLHDYDNFSEYSRFPIVIQSFEIEDVQYFQSTGKGGTKLPTVKLNAWESLVLNIADFATYSHAIIFNSLFTIFDRIDDQLSLNGIKYNTKEEFIKNVNLTELDNYDRDKMNEKITNEKTNPLSEYIKTLKIPLGIYSMKDDVALFSKDPKLEYYLLNKLGVSIFFSDFCYTGIKVFQPNTDYS